MPRQKNFEVEQVVGRAMDVFWEKGFECTSISDLTEATGVQRQSLYNAFGDKRDLFIRAFHKYDTEERRASLAALEAQGQPLEAIRTLFQTGVEQCLADKTQRGCFLVNTALSLHNLDEEIAAMVRASLEDLRSFFERQLQHAKVRKEIPESLDPVATASGLLASLIGIKVMARASTSRELLEQMSDQALRLLEA